MTKLKTSKHKTKNLSEKISNFSVELKYSKVLYRTTVMCYIRTSQPWIALFFWFFWCVRTNGSCCIASPIECYLIILFKAVHFERVL